MHERICVVDDVRTIGSNKLAFIRFLQVSSVQQLLHKILGVLTLRVLLFHSLKLLLKNCDPVTLLVRLFRVLTIRLILELLLVVLLFHLGLGASSLAAGLQEVSPNTLACYR